MAMVPNMAPIQAPTEVPIIAPILNLSKHSPIRPSAHQGCQSSQSGRMLHLKVKRDLKELTETGKFNDFLVLENYLDQCVKLRLSEGEKNLKEAHDVSTIITSK